MAANLAPKRSHYKLFGRRPGGKGGGVWQLAKTYTGHKYVLTQPHVHSFAHTCILNTPSMCVRAFASMHHEAGGANRARCRWVPGADGGERLSVAVVSRNFCAMCCPRSFLLPNGFQKNDEDKNKKNEKSVLFSHDHWGVGISNDFRFISSTLCTRRTAVFSLLLVLCELGAL